MVTNFEGSERFDSKSLNSSGMDELYLNRVIFWLGHHEWTFAGKKKLDPIKTEFHQLNV